MKKVLLGTSAIALAGAFATQASAAEWDVRIGGYMEQYIAFASSDQSGNDACSSCDYDGIDSKQDAEIFFEPSITLDNGLKIGANVQLEANTSSSDQIDESYMFIKGSFGEILLGSENSAGYKMQYAAPDVTFVGVNSGSLGNWIPFSGSELGANVFRGTLGSTYLENATNNDAHRFTYFTPRFSGFQAGVSYARDDSDDSSAQECDNCGGVNDIIDIAANYVQSFGSASVAISGRWGTASVSGGPNPDVWGVGANVGFSGFTIGGSYAVQNDAGLKSGRAWDAGVSYETGPWGVSVTYFNGRNRNDEQSDKFETLEQFLVGMSYKMAKGVTLNAFGGYADFEENARYCSSCAEEVDGFVIGTGIKISF